MIREFLRSVYHHMIGRSDAPAAPVQTEDLYPAPRIYNPEDFCSAKATPTALLRADEIRRTYNPGAYPENEAVHIKAAHERDHEDDAAFWRDSYR